MSIVKHTSVLVKAALAEVPPDARLVVVGGQTASGKSALAMTLAETFDGEIVGADSRQLYRGLPITSAGPTSTDLARVPHHLYGSVDPERTLNAADFVVLADRAIANIRGRGRLPIVVGGTGLYLRALRLGLDEAPPSDNTIRESLRAQLAADGLPSLLHKLRELDPRAVSALDVHNPVRVMRALEILMLGGTLEGRSVDVVLQRSPRPSVARACWVLPCPDPRAIETAIVTRVRQMFADGIVDEAKALAATLPADHSLLRTMGLEEALQVESGFYGVDAAKDAIALRTRHFARRQRTWFRKEPWWTSVGPSGVIPSAPKPTRP